MSRFKFCYVLLLLLTFAAAARAEDFTFTVPYSAKGVPADIKFNAQAGKQASAATRYKCSLYEPFGKLIAQKAGDPSRLEVEGPIKR